MPEGPEIRREADAVGRALAGRKATEVWFFHDRLKPYGNLLAGSGVHEVTSRGKAMLIAFESGHVLVTHNQLYGRWIVRKAGVEPRTGRSLRLAIRNRSHAALLYSASEIDVVEAAALETHPYLAKLGPDALDRSVTAKRIQARLSSDAFRRRSLAALLLHQGFLAGIGNYLRSEILHAAEIHPARRPADCAASELASIARAALNVTRRSYRTGGITSDPDLVRRLKAQGRSRAEYRFRVFGRDGRPCYRCGSEIVREERSGRRIYICPGCQV